MKSGFLIAIALTLALLSPASRAFSLSKRNVKKLPQSDLSNSTVVQEYTQTPIVVLHGINDHCQSMDGFVQMVSELMNGTAYIKCLEVGDGQISSLFMDMRSQAKVVCLGILDDPIFSQHATSGLNIIGASQGGLIARTVVETCNQVKFNKLISFGAPHAGVSSIPDCAFSTDFKCKIANVGTKYLVYFDKVQKLVAAASYYREVTRLDEYQKKSYFLTYINNENDVKSEIYKQRIVDLKIFAMFKWDNDTVVYPSESEWFGYFDSNKNIIKLID